ncbi:ankyrin repeat domain-containing protein 6 isoform X2 [Oryzias melastigma]|uniref:Ankyrin repeat domain-containing protein 6-like n=1 Tax=Oryzias melastigma TaxID=30732 RepID=A0A3B3CHF9_ORYME|nr:ankyrin repeat domain-containing protein 6 isoform X2 [Oryzias melastigma]XP_024128640.1 ankyrin repeat domain-containing protein 6 isoform X2 [Oryzias melastigma]XP_024128718.1 ankyrin repeat domain-containing protein 6 isoform X2 [Oryzias melastigma]
MENFVSKGSGVQTALHRAAKVGNAQTVAALINGGCAVDLQDRDGNTALHEASWHGFSPCVKQLIKAGADVKLRNKVGNIALHLACLNAHTQTARLLLLGGSSPDSQNAKGETPLHVAAALNHKKTVQILLEVGADRTIQNRAGKTALDKARDNRHKEVALLLMDALQAGCLSRKTPKLRPKSGCRAETQQGKDRSSTVEESPSSGSTDSRTDVQAGKENDSPEYQHDQREALSDEEDAGSVPTGRAFQLYTLYRDRDGRIQQAPASRCRCGPQLKRLEEQLKDTQEETRLKILKVQEQVSRRLDRMERQSRHQLKVLDVINQDRAAAERKSLMSRMEQSAARIRAEARMAQAAVRQELRRWCFSWVEGVPAEGQYEKLLLSPSVEPSEADPESAPLLSGDSSLLLESPNTEDTEGGTYFEMKVDRCSDAEQNSALPPPSAEQSSHLPLDSSDPCWPSSELQGSSEGRSSVNSGGRPDSSTVLEFFSDRPAELTFSQERNNLHAMEVTQRFFETVSAQLELWCHRKILEAEQQAELRAQVDKKELLQQISTLEAELQKLKTNENGEN